jgi:hypothetical protein
MFGSHNQPGWLDLSDYVVHFTKSGTRNALDTLLAILWSRLLLRGPTPFGAARRIASIAESQRVVCFSEVPLGFLARVADRRNSLYGIGFTKRFVLDRGGAPLWYLEYGTAPQMAFQRMVDDHARNLQLDHPIWQVTPFVDYPSGPNSPYTYDFRWEREWRVRADVAFHQTEVALLLLPEAEHNVARTFFYGHVADNTGPGYFCHYIDPRWDHTRIAQYLATPAVASAG